MAKPALDVVRRHEAAPERAPARKVTPTSTRAKLLGTGLVVGAGLGAYALLRDSRPPAYTIKYVDVALEVTRGTKTETKTVKVRADNSCFSSIEHYRALSANGPIVLDENQNILVCAIRTQTDATITKLVATCEGATMTRCTAYKGTLAYKPSGVDDDGTAKPPITIQNTKTNATNFI